MSLDALMNSIVGCQCGICCGTNLPCDNCLESTMSANGIDMKHIEKFRGLSMKQSGYQYPFEFSDMADALKKHRREEQEGAPPQQTTEQG